MTFAMALHFETEVAAMCCHASVVILTNANPEYTRMIEGAFFGVENGAGGATDGVPADSAVSGLV